MGNPNESQVQTKKRRKYQRAARKPPFGHAVATLGASRAGAFRHAEDAGWGEAGGQSDLAFDAGVLFEGGTVEAQAGVLQRVVTAYDGLKGSNTKKVSSAGAVQTKLEVSEPGDVYEQEADAVADQVMRMPAPVPPPPEDSASGNGKGEMVPLHNRLPRQSAVFPYLVVYKFITHTDK